MTESDEFYEEYQDDRAEGVGCIIWGAFLLVLIIMSIVIAYTILHDMIGI